MAKSVHTTTRRAALVGIATGALAATAGSALAGTTDLAEHPDAELLELGRQYDAIQARIWDAFKRVNSIMPSDSPEPGIPDALKVQPGDRALDIPKPLKWDGTPSDKYSWRHVDELRQARRVKHYFGPVTLEATEYQDFREVMEAALAYVTARNQPWPEAQARADEIVAAHDAHRAALSSGGSEATEIESEIDGLNDEARPISDAIIHTRAVTLDGMMVKARAFRWLYPDDPEEMEPSDQHATDDGLLRSIVQDLLAMRIA